MDNQRFILFLVLAAIIIMLWQAWEAEQRPAPAPAAEAPKTQPAPSAPEGAVPEAPAVARTTTPQPTPEKIEQGRRVHVTTDVLDVELDTIGGDIRRVSLPKYSVSVDKPDQPFVLLSDSPDNVYITQTGLIGRDREYPYHRTVYKADAEKYVLKPGQDHLDVVLSWRAPDGVRYKKIYGFSRNRYVIDLRYEVDNTTSRPWQGFLYTQFLRQRPEQAHGLFRLPIYIGAAIYTPEDKYQKVTFDDMAEEALNRKVEGGWVAMLQHYFVGAWLPSGDTTHLFYSDDLGQGRFNIGLKDVQPTDVEPGATGKLSTQLYLGPKEHKRLAKLSEGMELTVDFGWLTFISAPLFWLLVWIHGVVGNWGWAIIILTLLIKLAFFPLSAASYKSMAHMRRVQPKLKSIKERYGNDKQRFNQAMMELYKTEKINPLGGCLPIVIQIPVFIALYWVLLESVEMRHAPFALWINDLSSPDPYFVLPIIMGITMFAQTYLNPAPMDPMQKKIMTFMPLMFTVFFLFFPSGLVLYWVVNNILSIAQQWQITRMIERKGT